MMNIPGQIGRLTRAVAFAAVVCALLLKSLAFAPSPNAASARFGAFEAISAFVPADDCKSDGDAPHRGPLHDHGHCVLCVSCGAGAQADRAVLTTAEIAFAPMRNVAGWRSGFELRFRWGLAGSSAACVRVS